MGKIHYRKGYALTLLVVVNLFKICRIPDCQISSKTKRKQRACFHNYFGLFSSLHKEMNRCSLK